jgi:dipeptidyl aminopeptidase/acylaminoacyl peptidase
MLQHLRIFSTFISIFIFNSSAAHAQKVDPALFGALPAISQAEISPNGETIAVLQNINGDSVVVFFEPNNPNAAPEGVGIGAVKARRLQWVDDEYLLLLASVAKQTRTATGLETIEFFRWFAISKSERKLKMLFKKDAGYFVPSPGSILASTPSNPGSAIFARWTPRARAATQRRPSRIQNQKIDMGDGYSLFEVDLKTGRDRIKWKGASDTVDWVIDANGEAILRIDYDEDHKERKIYRRREGSRTFEVIKTIKESSGSGSTISFYGPGNANDEIYATTYGSGDKRALVNFSVSSGKVAGTVFRHDRYDIDSVIYDPRQATATGVRYIDNLPRVFHLNPADQKLQDSLGAALPGSAPMIISRSADGAKMIIRAVYEDRPDELYLFDKATRNLAFFSSTAPALAGRIYAEKSTFNYITPDSLKIDGYLTTPVNVEKNNMPLIVLPHGGPEGRDDQSFNWWAFFYAARGYAVYQPNFRGSNGYGFNFRKSGFGEWGRKMQSDITYGVKKLIDDGIVDPARICIVGASYGGYAALAGATLTPDIYACAVSVNGVSDLPAMIGEASRDSSISANFWERRIGSRFRDAAELNAVSPSKHAENVRAPIMLIHGKDDTVVPFRQSEVMNEALNAAGKAHEFVPLEGEDHWLSSGDTRTEMLHKSIEFIDRHIGE